MQEVMRRMNYVEAVHVVVNGYKVMGKRVVKVVDDCESLASPRLGHRTDVCSYNNLRRIQNRYWHASVNSGSLPVTRTT